VDGRLEGRDDPELTGVAPLDRAGPSELSLLSHPRYAAQVAATKAGALLVEASLADRLDARTPAILVRNAQRAMAQILPQLYPERRPDPGVHPTALIAPDAVIGADVSIGAHAQIGAGARIGDRARIGAYTDVGADCVLAEDVVLFPHVTLYPRVRIGPRSVVHSGARLGVDGFGYVWDGSAHRKVPQVGGCRIGADVEIGANTTIDRGSIGDTEIGDDVKIDNLVHIGHNVRIGAHSIVIAQVGVSGSTVIGTGVTVAGQVGIAGHLTIGDRATVAAQAGVFGDLEGGRTYSGYPARPHREALRAQAALFRLPRLMDRIRALERAIFGKEQGSE
jgi:UDP-3-O-[3-hydroxymyristoyl] glucosamine N-acyltransferase